MSGDNRAVCEYFLRGYCTFGTECWFLHVQPQVQESAAGDDIVEGDSSDAGSNNSFFVGNTPSVISRYSNVEVDLEESECLVCFSSYDDDEYRPRVMPCGHTICSKCLERTIREESKMCPKCRTRYSASNVAEVPVNFSLEGIVKSIRISENTNDTHSECTEHQLSVTLRCSAHKAWICQSCLIEDHSSDSCKIITIVEELDNKKSRQRDLSEPFLNRFEESCKKVKNCQKQYKNQLNGYDEVIVNHENMIVRLQEEIQRKKNARIQIEERITVFDKKLGNLDDKRSSFDQSITSLETSKTIREVSRCSIAIQNEAKKLDRISQDIETEIDLMLEALKVKDDYILGYPKISFRNGKPHLHVLPDNDTNNLQDDGEECEDCDDDVNEDSDDEDDDDDSDDDEDEDEDEYETAPPQTDGVVTFFDIAWPEEKPRRMYIKMLGNTVRARQHLLLCTGQWGPSYKDLYFSIHRKKDQPGEYLVMSPYDGEKAEALLKDVTVNDTVKCIYEPGLISGCRSEGDMNNAFFRVYLRDKPGYINKTGFAQVISGLEILQDVAKSDEIHKIRIVDCGVVLFW